nr:uncharacterized protein LOC116424396 isoform X1 [Nomia melanderi]
MLMLSGVILYYIPESRPYARKICYALIDITANFLKSVLSVQESDYVYEAIKSKYHRARYDQSLNAQRRRSREGQENTEDFERAHVYSAKLKTSLDENGLREFREKKKLNRKLSKDIRHSRHYLRSSIIKKASDPRVDMAKLSHFYTDRIDDIQKYVKTNLCGVNRINGSVEDYALLISGSPRQMAMLDQKYEKDDVVLVEDPYCKVEYKECGTSTDRLSTKTEGSASEQEGPTRDHNNHTESGIETYVKDVDLSFTPEAEVSRYFDYPESYQSNTYQCGGKCCEGDNGCSMSSADINREILNTELSNETKNVLKSSKSMVNSKIHDKGENYTNHGRESRLMKSNNLNNDRRVNFQDDGEIITQNHEELTRPRNNISSRSIHRNKLIDHCCNNVPYYTDRDGEADDENSQHGRRIIAKYEIDDRPQRESHAYKTYSDDSIFDYDNFYTKPILKNQFKPVLLRAVNWIFGGCPGASRRVATKRGVVGKEETQEFTDEWLL